MSEKKCCSVPCYVEDVVNKNDTKSCVVFFLGSDVVIDVTVTDNFIGTIREFMSNNFDDSKKEGFCIHVISTNSLKEILEVTKK